MTNLFKPLEKDGVPQPVVVGDNIEKTTVIKVENVLVKDKEVYVKGVNSDDGSIFLDNAKKMVVKFKTKFKKEPRVVPVLRDNAPLATNPFITDVTTEGFTIEFQNKITTEVDWIAIERK